MTNIKDGYGVESNENKCGEGEIIDTEMDLSNVNIGITLHRILKHRKQTLVAELRDTCFGFSRLCLECVKINCLIFTRLSGEWVVKYSMMIKMIVFETLSKVTYTLIAKDWLKNIDGKLEQSSLQLKCKYINNIAFGAVEKFRDNLIING
ncbi:hypothetical protein BJ944DRAFT_240545 [Cunninghamella echinulata]|nr:hypothetical protein BJ944DRAFT_240545 [Cunninghamella echinulata]